MTKRYHYAASLSWGGDEPEHEVSVSFTVAWGTPESGRFGAPEDYDPGSDDLVEDVRLETVNDRPRPWGMGFGFLPDDDFAAAVIEKLEAHEAEMLTAALEQEAERTWDRA